ncbi:MAG: A/G-specific adenine glycosylase [Myxococcales bacterium]|nr:MAG: A/G-specific adenine glycosylase [Myxococcales bacterium]
MPQTSSKLSISQPLALTDSFEHRKIRRALLTWYQKNKRDLPWRTSSDPYAIWVSEIMLQQTQVSTVIPYYERFMKRFPSLKSLASADEDEVLKHWSGLGYYRRARFLHRGVREVQARYGGELPKDAKERQSISGIGRYTAGAIGSIAFDQPEAIVDGNVARVLSRLLGITAPLGSKESEQLLWELASLLAKGRQPGDLNQALMELGATLCTPKQASCGLCPLKAKCFAYKHEQVAALPVARVRKAPREEHWVTVMALASAKSGAQEKRVWMVKQDGSRFAGLWGLPSMQGKGAGDARRILGESCIDAVLERKARGHIEHVLSHRKMKVELWLASGAKARKSSTRQLVPVGDIKGMGVSTLTRKLLDLRVCRP